MKFCTHVVKKAQEKRSWYGRGERKRREERKKKRESSFSLERYYRFYFVIPNTDTVFTFVYQQIPLSLSLSLSLSLIFRSSHNQKPKHATSQNLSVSSLRLYLHCITPLIRAPIYSSSSPRDHQDATHRHTNPNIKFNHVHMSPADPFVA